MPKDLSGGGSIQQLDACSQADPEFAGWRPTSGSVVAGNGIGGMSENGLYRTFQKMDLNGHFMGKMMMKEWI